MWPVITPVQPGTGLGPVQAARDETADFAYQEGVWLRALLPSLQHGADIHQHFLFCSNREGDGDGTSINPGSW